MMLPVFFTRLVRFGGLAIVVVCLTTSLVSAQGGGSEINGTVFDQAGAVLPGATVQSPTRPPAPSATPSRVPKVAFILPMLTLRGTYTVRLELPGFQSQSRARPCVAGRAGADRGFHADSGHGG